MLRSGSIRQYVENPIRREVIKQKQYNREIGFYDIDFELPINIEPCAGYVTPMSKAFELGYSIIKEWLSRNSSRDITKDPVPMVINISDGAPTDEFGYVMSDFSTVINEANKIKQISCPDGNPLIFNIHLSPDSSTEEIQFPMSKNQIPNGDELSGLLFDLSSTLPNSMVEAGHISGFTDLKEGVKTFMSNVKEVEKFVQFLNFGTKGTDGGRVIR